jgi:hypothetical protein
LARRGGNWQATNGPGRRIAAAGASEHEGDLAGQVTGFDQTVRFGDVVEGECAFWVSA